MAREASQEQMDKQLADPPFHLKLPKPSQSSPDAALCHPLLHAKGREPLPHPRLKLQAARKTVMFARNTVKLS